MCVRMLRVVKSFSRVWLLFPVKKGVIVVCNNFGCLTEWTECVDASCRMVGSKYGDGLSYAIIDFQTKPSLQYHNHRLAFLLASNLYF